MKTNDFKVGDLVRVKKDISYEEFVGLCRGFKIYADDIIHDVFYSHSQKIIDLNTMSSGNLVISFMNRKGYVFNAKWFEHFDYLDVI